MSFRRNAFVQDYKRKCVYSGHDSVLRTGAGIVFLALDTDDLMSKKVPVALIGEGNDRKEDIMIIQEIWWHMSRTKINSLVRSSFQAKKPH